MLGYAGRREFDTYTNSITSVFRIAFGQFEYSDFLNDGGNQNFEGLGLGAVAWTINIIYWAIFLMFAVFITNILIAVVTDAYEIHADKAELVAYDVYCVLLLKQIIFMCISTCFDLSSKCKYTQMGFKDESMLHVPSVQVNIYVFKSKQ